ncbi:hypothetical protein COV11_01405 [Candidatus Woesearchaeota archaeon CG10_big_fil_rev_8_21_14_0_10_30_7]|nr:MAG: hypothetical protein COV11_01405 [Candidatus Woesearchaeota archaeon CG10_big_fil_rev_8_21_14_0_10_30_7]
MKKLFNDFILIIGILLSIAVIYMALLKLTNHSPTLAQMNSAFIGIITTIIFKLKFNTGKFTEFMERTKEDLKELKFEIKESNNKLDILSKDVLLIKSRLLR